MPLVCDQRTDANTMDHLKLDPALNAKLSRAASPAVGLEVSIRTVGQPDETQWQELQRHGVRGTAPLGRVYTASLSLKDVAELSDKSWVRLLSLAQRMQAL